MNIEDYRDYCLSLGTDVEEKLPFVQFKNGEGVIVFYVCGHMFCFFDLNDFQDILLNTDSVNIWRSAAGMPPLEEYAKQMNAKWNK